MIGRRHPEGMNGIRWRCWRQSPTAGGAFKPANDWSFAATGFVARLVVAQQAYQAEHVGSSQTKDEVRQLDDVGRQLDVHSDFVVGCGRIDRRTKASHQVRRLRTKASLLTAVYHMPKDGTFTRDLGAIIVDETRPASLPDLPKR